jgi:hypothetical protein
MEAWNESGRVQGIGLYSPGIALNKEEGDWEVDLGQRDFGRRIQCRLEVEDDDAVAGEWV